MNRISTTHVGSLIRPAELRDHFETHGRSGVDDPAFADRLAGAVSAVVKRQAEIGIDILNDGEMSKSGWIHYVYERVSGIALRTMTLTEDDVTAALPRSAPREALRGSEGRFTPFWAERLEPGEKAAIWVCTGPIAYDPAHAAVDIDIANLRRACEQAGAHDGFLNAVAPGSLYWLANEHYQTEEAFMFAWADALSAEYRRIVDAGFSLQVDDAVMWHKYGTLKLQGGTVDEYRRWASLRVDALNHALAGIPAQSVRYHVCSGSQPGPHVLDPPLADILGHVLKVRAGCVLVEQANARHEHEWEVWRDVSLPDYMSIAPGVVTHHTQMVEHPELVAQRLVRIANVVGGDRVLASTDCGFAQHAVRRRVPLWTQWAKLEALVEGARLATRKIWGSAADA
jgi:5-methyltetrahydropteroyltriglutamate--homocysteine methyltransferase